MEQAVSIPSKSLRDRKCLALALRLLPRRGSLNTSEALEYEDAVHNVVGKQMYLESASIAVVDWISSSREYSCASGLDLDRVEREISNIFSLVITEWKRAPLPKRAS
jgi:hypothetical protein